MNPAGSPVSHERATQGPAPRLPLFPATSRARRLVRTQSTSTHQRNFRRASALLFPARPANHRRAIAVTTVPRAARGGLPSDFRGPALKRAGRLAAGVDRHFCHTARRYRESHHHFHARITDFQRHDAGRSGSNRFGGKRLATRTRRPGQSRAQRREQFARICICSGRYSHAARIRTGARTGRAGRTHCGFRPGCAIGGQLACAWTLKSVRLNGAPRADATRIVRAPLLIY